MSLSPLIVGDDVAMAVKPLVMLSHRKLLAAELSKWLARLPSVFLGNSEVTRGLGQTLISSSLDAVLCRVTIIQKIYVKKLCRCQMKHERGSNGETGPC